MALQASHVGYRFLVLFFNCMLTFGSYFCFDMPSVLQDVFTEVNNCTNSSGYTYTAADNVSCNNCTDCLGMSDADYNLLYAIYAWTNALVVLGAGFLIDKLGNRIGVFIFSSLCLLGSSTFAVGIFLKGTSALLPVMLIGRLLFGSGNGSLTIVQNRITAYWFKDKELAMAFGITLAFSRLGSVLNFFLTQSFEEAHGLTWTLWGGAMLCGLGFISAIVVSILDSYGVRQLGDEGNMKSESKKLKITDIKNLSLSFWLVALAIMFFYNGVFPFVADASSQLPFGAGPAFDDADLLLWIMVLDQAGDQPTVVPWCKFIETKYGKKYDIDKKTASYLAGAVYDASMILSPFLGGLIDIIGKRGYLSLLTAVLTIPVFGVFAFSEVYPLFGTLWLGITYSFAAASMWPSIPLVVSQATVGTAMGLTTSIQMIGIGISNIVVGQILGSQDGQTDSEKLRRWKLVMIFLLANVIGCICTTIGLNISDRRRGGILNISRRQKRSAEISNIQASEAEASTSEEEREPLLAEKHRYLRDGNALN